MSRKLAVVVTGATGQQGGAVVKNLLERGHEVRAVTRSTDSAKARGLANAGAGLEHASPRRLGRPRVRRIQQPINEVIPMSRIPTHTVEDPPLHRGRSCKRSSRPPRWGAPRT